MLEFDRFKEKLMKKIGRNDPCPCGSGKKFKKCCEATMLGGRFKAAKLDNTAAASVQKTAGLSSFFKTSLAATPKKPMPPEEKPEEKQGEGEANS